MKKLMIAAFAIAFAAVAQAASFTWGQDAGYLNAGDGNWNYATPGMTAYLFDVAVYSQTQAVADFYASGTLTGALSTSVVGNQDEGAKPIVWSDEFDYAVTETWNAYYAIIDDGKLYISDTAIAEILDVGAYPIAFGDQDDFSNDPFAAGAEYTGAGWYTASSSSVPEPTSALMLLVGLAGLALKRKVA